MTSLSVKELAIDGRLSPTDLAFESGELVAVVGPNGGGKTSLLRALARTDEAKGKVALGGRDLDDMGEAERRRALSFLPASRDVRWPIPVRDLIALGGSDGETLDHLIEQLELDHLAQRPANELSTGERARALFARALVADPRLLLLDEPLSNLDPYWVERFLQVCRDVANSGRIVLVSLHDLSLLGRFDRTLLVADGKVQMDETPAALLDSERFEEVFRVRRDGDRWTISPTADRRSLP